MPRQGLFERLRKRLRLRLNRDWSFIPEGVRAGQGHERVLVIARGTVPSVDYYVTGALDRDELARYRVVTDAELPAWLGPRSTQRLERPTRIILVRMPASGWLDVLLRDAALVTEVIWVIDDDLPAAVEDGWLPDDFRLRLVDDFLRFRDRFAPHVDRIWASTPAVASRFPADRVTLVPPRAVTRPDAWQSPPLTVFYHGTGAHRREHQFLVPVLERIQAESADAEVEIVGGDGVYRQFRHIPRVRVIHPLPWPSYLGYLRAHPHHLGLVPLLDTPFNRGRSAVKLLELGAIGAVGVFSRRSPYDAHDGEPLVHLCGDDPGEWCATVLGLLDTLRSRRQRAPVEPP